MTKYDTIMDCLTMVEARMRTFSTNCTLMSPRRGYEVPWQDAADEAAILRGLLIQAREEAGGGRTIEKKEKLA